MWWLLRFSIALHCVHSVRIINMRVPEVIQYGTKDAVTLDCEFVADNVTGLVVKWFFMHKSQPVYQWIPPKRPQSLGVLKNKVDLTYRVSHNVYTQHRALRILSPGLELSGDYICVVSTFLAEDQKTKPMTIFVPERQFQLVQDRLDDDYVNIICSAEGVYPKPNLTIMVDSSTVVGAKTSTSVEGGRYTALASAVLRVAELPASVELLCELHVPRANYISRKRDIFYRDPPPAPPPPSVSSDTQRAPESASAAGCSVNTSRSPLALLVVCLLRLQPLRRLDFGT